MSRNNGIKNLSDLLARSRFLTPDSLKSTPKTSFQDILNKDTGAILASGAKNIDMSKSRAPNDAVKHNYEVYPLALVKRTGTLAGRSVLVGPTRQGHMRTLGWGLDRLNQINRANKIRWTLNLQRFHERPGKKRLRLRNEKQKRDFNKGIHRLFELVNEARRKGH